MELDTGEVVTAHCPNSGSLKTCGDPGSPVLLSHSDDPRRRTQWTWELVKANGTWVGINTLLPNRLVEKAIREKLVPELAAWDLVRREAPMGKRSRVDLLLERDGQPCYLEIKNVTMVVDGVAYFPDAVTERGRKHLEDLLQAVESGYCGQMFFLVQRGDGRVLRPADDIDPAYGETLRRVAERGVRILAYRAEVTPQAVTLVEPIPVEL